MDSHNHFPLRPQPLHPWIDCDNRCSKTAFIQIVFFAWVTLVAQIVLNLRYEVIPLPACVGLHSLCDYRMYAITAGNMIITGFFMCLTAASSALGIYLATLTKNAPGMILGHYPQLLSVFMAFGCWKLSATTPFNPSQSIPIMRSR